MALELREDSLGDAHNALFLATASNLAYEPPEVGEPAFREQLGLETTFCKAGNTQAYVGTNAEHIVVAFRGTESPATLDGLKDMLLNDARNLLIVPSGALTALPFHLLVVDEPAIAVPSIGSARDFAAYREPAWLIKRHAVTILPSVASLNAPTQFFEPQSAPAGP